MTREASMFYAKVLDDFLLLTLYVHFDEENDRWRLMRKPLETSDVSLLVLLRYL